MRYFFALYKLIGISISEQAKILLCRALPLAAARRRRRRLVSI